MDSFHEKESGWPVMAVKQVLPDLQRESYTGTLTLQASGKFSMHPEDSFANRFSASFSTVRCTLRCALGGMHCVADCGFSYLNKYGRVGNRLLRAIRRPWMILLKWAKNRAVLSVLINKPPLSPREAHFCALSKANLDVQYHKRGILKPQQRNVLEVFKTPHFLGLVTTPFLCPHDLKCFER